VALLDVLAVEGKPLSQIVDPLRRYHASGEINRRVRDTAAVIEAVASERADAPVISRLDGLLVRYPDWWFNIRPSNTEPVLRLNLEADTEAKMVEERDRMLARIEELGA
jgi:phosphomannomutase